jgi:U2-associated protein SR140
MPESSKIKEFPDISNKLTAPTKKSLFERQRAEAEAKRQREEAETAAVYEDFVKSFDDESGPAPGVGNKFTDNGYGGGSGFGPGVPPPIRPGASKRHFAPSVGARSGPGSLGPPPPSLARKRALDGSFSHHKDKGIFAFEEATSVPTDAKAVFQASDDEDEDEGNRSPAERAAPKPTIHLSSLPPGTSAAVIKALFPPNMTIDAVRLLPPATPASTERRSFAAIVTLAKDTPASDIDATVNTLQNRYLGLGFNLSLSRHLSSAVLGSTGTGALPSLTTSLPFGARPVPLGPTHPLNRAPPPSMRGGYPPPSYNAVGQYGRGSNAQPPLQVVVTQPSDIKQLKLIHKTIEAVLTNGPEFEALLMTRHEVQREEKWTWLWNARSIGGVYYRWRLWEILSGLKGPNSKGRSGQNTSQQLFEGGAPWQPPEQPLRFEFTMRQEDFVSDHDYNSSEEDESGDESARRPAGLDLTAETGMAEYLNPLQKAKLTHLLNRLPITTARLRKGDVARVTAYAINHAGRGSEEVVQMLIANVERPFALAKDASARKAEADAGGSDLDEGTGKDKRDKEPDDPSSAKLIALYLISDLLSSSSTSGVSHAWRYRQLFEAAIRSQHVFERLGLLEKEMGWGRLRAEKWRRAVTQILGLWEGWCVFSSKAQDDFMRGFTESAEGKAEKETLRSAASKESREKNKTKWKAVEDRVDDIAVTSNVDEEAAANDVDGEPIDDVDVDVDVDGELMEDDDFDGEPMTDDVDILDSESTAKEPESNDSILVDSEAASQTQNGAGLESKASEARRRRPRAVDMFADSDGE